MSTSLLGLVLAAMPMASSRAEACEPARVGPNVAAQPEEWRQAVEDLVAATGAPGQPWSCVGGEIDLLVREGSATMTVVDAEGQSISRGVESPEEIEPLGEALLAKPLPPPAPEVQEKPAPEKQDQPAGEKKQKNLGPLPAARLLASASIGPRYAGGANLVWGGLTLAAMLPPAPWGGGVWLRYDGMSTSLDEHGPRMREICIGAKATRGFRLGAVELRAAVAPSLAVVTLEEVHGFAGPGGPTFSPQYETDFDFRLGLEGQAALPVTRRVRGVLTLDGEIAPSELKRASEPRGPSRFPLYTLGLGLGVEVAIP